MDTSETLKKMRLAAIPDLGKGLPFEYGESPRIDAQIKIDNKGDYYYLDDVTGEPICQLERQDQLQEMVKRGDETYKALLTRLINAGYVSPIDWSMGQLWLAFYMAEKHNKIWVQDEWQNIRIKEE